MHSFFSRWPIRTQVASVLLGVVILVLATMALVNAQSAGDALTETSVAGLNNSLDLADALLDNQFQALEMMVANLSEVFAKNLGGEVRVDRHLQQVVNGERVPIIYAGNQPLIERYELPDAFSRATGGVATVFVRAGDDFLRVTTSLTRTDGSRAQGTWLGKGHPGYARLLAGQPYVGYAKLFGKDYVTRYQPVTDGDGKVVAILFVGADISAIVASTFEALADIRIGASGGLLIADAKGAVLNDQHLELGNALPEFRDANGHLPFAGLNPGAGELLQFSQKDDQGKVRQRLVAWRYLPKWQWILVGGSYSDEFTAAATRLRWQSFVLSCGGLLILVVLGRLVLGRSLRPLLRVIDVLTEVGNGRISNLNLAVAHASRNEVHAMGNAVQRMAENMKQLIGGVHSSVATVGQSSTSIAELAQQQLGSAGAVKDQCLQIAAAAEELSTSFNEVLSRVDRSAGDAAEVDRQAQQVNLQVEGMAKGTVAMQAQLDMAVRNLGELDRSSNAISDVVQLISGIADQTNLLALNAAIEAARAGEQGRGFAVVADEVRNLASQTQQSTKHIAQIIGELQQQVKLVMAAMTDAKHQADDAEQQVQLSRRGLAEVVDRISSVADQLTSVAATVEQQCSVTVQLTEMQQELLLKSQQSANDASSVNGSALALGGVATDLRNAASVFI